MNSNLTRNPNICRSGRGPCIHIYTWPIQYRVCAKTRCVSMLRLHCHGWTWLTLTQTPHTHTFLLFYFNILLCSKLFHSVITPSLDWFPESCFTMAFFVCCWIWNLPGKWRLTVNPALLAACTYFCLFSHLCRAVDEWINLCLFPFKKTEMILLFLWQLHQYQYHTLSFHFNKTIMRT